MLEFDEIIEKIKDIISVQDVKDNKNKKIFLKDVAKILGISQSNFTVMKTRGKIPLESIINFCVKRKISINWLLFDQSPDSLIRSTDECWIRYHSNLSVSAGGGAYDDENIETNYIQLSPEFLKFLPMVKNDYKNLIALNVTGDSMEPTLNNNSIIFVDKNRNNMFKEGVFAFTTKHGLFVKRIQKRPDGNLDIISDNKDYPSQILNSEEIMLIGKVISCFGKVY